MIKNEYSKLKSVIVGNELDSELRNFDETFKLFYKKNIKDYYYCDFCDYTINKEIIYERNEDLNNLAKLLESYNVKVYRPNKVQIKNFKTPFFSSFLSASSNVRDTALVYKDYIIETPMSIKSRFFENDNLYDIFKEFMLNKNIKWIKGPNPRLENKNLDTLDYDEIRDFSILEKDYDILIDAAQYIKMNDDLICSISSKNHYLGSKWMENILKDQCKIHYITGLIDNHIDGTLLPINENTFLYNSYELKKDIRDCLPQKFKNYNFIDVNTDNVRNINKIYEKYNTKFIQLASIRGMDMNVLNIDENTIIVNEDSINVIEQLNKLKFNVIPIKFRHSELFAGGIHCSTLDLEREY